MKIQSLPVHLPVAPPPARDGQPPRGEQEASPPRPSAPQRPQGADPRWQREPVALPQRPALRAFAEIQAMDRAEFMRQGGRLDLYA